MTLTYFASLALFIGPPLLALLILVPRDVWRWLRYRSQAVSWRPYTILLAHVALALAYTTPWDNYLVASGVWWYDPARVTGLTIGYVPIEEYSFFVLQTLFSGLWFLAMRKLPAASPAPMRPAPALRIALSLITALTGATFLTLWLSGWEPGTYLSLILAWASLPILIQLAFGADILWGHRRLLALSVIPTTLYLWAMDYTSIGAGIWSIDPQQTTGIMLGVLPVEEMIFFLVTNLIIALGMALMLAPESQRRAAQIARDLKKVSRNANAIP